MKDLYFTNLPEGNPIIGDASHLLEIRRKTKDLRQMVSSSSSVLYVNNEPNNLDIMDRNNLKNLELDFAAKNLKL